MPEKWTGRLIGKMHNERITYAELAEEMGVNKSYISMLLNGRRKPPNIELTSVCVFRNCDLLIIVNCSSKYRNKNNFLDFAIKRRCRNNSTRKGDIHRLPNQITGPPHQGDRPLPARRPI